MSLLWNDRLGAAALGLPLGTWTLPAPPNRLPAAPVSASLVVVVEGRAALAAARRGRRITEAQHRTARRELDDLIDQLALIEVTRDLVTTAADLAESEGLRGYDAMHLAATTIAGATVLCSADRDLCEAASRLGFHVANPLDS